MRDVLKLVKIRKELKKLINEKQIAVNGKIIKEINYPLMLYDSITLLNIKKNYKLVMVGKRLSVVEASEKEASHKLYKVLGKKVLSEKIIQINLNQGKNIISDEKLNVGDFVVLNNKENKITKTITLKKDTDVLVIAGKHMGKNGSIKELLEQGNEKVALIKTSLGEIKTNIKNVFVKE
jgi:ribosomal protein S4E